MDERNNKGQFVKGRKGALEDLTGRRFGRLVVVSRSENISGRTVWNCKCDCGNEKKVYATNLKRGKTKSCGCWHDEATKIKEFSDLTGMRFGRLTVIEKAERKNRQIMWVCKCDCGNEKCVSSGNLKNGCTKSCGCLHDESAKTSAKTHGMSKTRLFKIWNGMKQRCYNPNGEKYSIYGGRGIKVCDEWLHDFQKFCDWAMTNGYEDNLTIDRIENDGNYEPSNCRWTTNKKQANNRRSNHFVEIDGEIKTMAEWIESGIYEADKATIYKRISRGWSDIEAITKPVQKQFRRNKKSE